MCARDRVFTFVESGQPPPPPQQCDRVCVGVNVCVRAPRSRRVYRACVCALSASGNSTPSVYSIILLLSHTRRAIAVHGPERSRQKINFILYVVRFLKDSRCFFPSVSVSGRKRCIGYLSQLLCACRFRVSRPSPAARSMDCRREKVR